MLPIFRGGKAFRTLLVEALSIRNIGILRQLGCSCDKKPVLCNSLLSGVESALSEFGTPVALPCSTDDPVPASQ